MEPEIYDYPEDVEPVALPDKYPKNKKAEDVKKEYGEQFVFKKGPPRKKRKGISYEEAMKKYGEEYEFKKGPPKKKRNHRVLKADPKQYVLGPQGRKVKAKKKVVKRKAPKKRKSRKPRTSDTGYAYERSLEARLGMLNNKGRISKRVLGRVDRTDPTHWQSGIASERWKRARYDRNSKIAWHKTSRMNTTLSYRYAKWPPQKFLREDYQVVPWVKMYQAGNPATKGKKLITFERKGKKYNKLVHEGHRARKPKA